MLSKKQISLIIIIIIPIFLQLLLQPYGSRFVYGAYILLVIAAFNIKFNFKYVPQHFKKIIFVNIFLSLIIVYQMLTFSESSSIYFRSLLPFFIGSLIILLFYSGNYSGEQPLQSYVLKSLGTAFIIQLLLSLIESFKGSFIISQYNWAISSYSSITQSGFLNRFILRIPALINPFSYLKIGLSGLYGQHNMWALQLPFYNLIFAYAYVKYRKKYFLFILFLIAIAQILNTTRTAMFAIILTDILIYFKYFYKRKIFIKTFIGIITAIFLIINMEGIYDYFARYFLRTDTFTIRTDIFISAADYLWNETSTLFLGMGYSEISKLVILLLKRQNYSVELTSFENGFLDIIFLYGIVGFLLFLYLLKLMVAKRHENKKNYFNYLLILNIIILALSLSHIFQLHVYPFVIFAFILFSMDQPDHSQGIPNASYITPGT